MLKERFTVHGSGLNKDRNTETPLLEMRGGVFNCKGIPNK
jgi:hypothetical protein